ncbi:MAG TPA: S8/S53 family peptidase [Mycobacteriales bacterium]|nr:S8/S53 family peptidase [Mycobacteriales bacterium]
MSDVDSGQTYPECRPDQIVVGLPHVRLVGHRLVELGVWGGGSGRVVPDDRLGLALLTDLAGLPEVAGRVRAEYPAEIAALEAGGRSFTPLDLLLFTLRRGFGAEYAGWTPLLGKNRVLDRVDGTPYHWPIAMGADQPVPVDPVPVDGPGRPSADPGLGTDVRVGVLDVGLYPHPDLAGRYIAAPDALIEPKPDEVMQPWAGHATFVADLILRQAPGARLEVHRLLDASDGQATLWDAARELVRFDTSGVEVLNVSFGCYTADGQPPLLMEQAIDRLGSGIVVVAAAGNHGRHTDLAAGITPRSASWPAALDRVVAIGADDGHGRRAPFSPDLPWVARTAPGVGVEAAYLDATVQPWAEGPATPSTVRFHGRARWSGTSFAAATISGAIAAGMVPDRVSAHEALQRLLPPDEETAETY